MHRQFIMPGFLLLILLAGVMVILGILNKAETVTVRVVLTGSEGLPVTGHSVIDGNEYLIDEVLPAEITATAKRLSLLVESPESSEIITAELFVNGEYQMTGRQRQIEITVRGKTMFTPRLVRLRAF